MFLASAAIACLSAAPATAQSGTRGDSVGADAVDAVTQPLSDLGLRSKDIPLILQLAQAQPYDLELMSDCEKVRTEIVRLDEVLGPDADAPAEAEGLVNKGLKMGGNVLGSFIPFRGIVRQLSGANAEQAKWEAAVYAGVARRSFLKGYGKGLQCATSEEAAVQSAQDILGLGR